MNTLLPLLLLGQQVTVSVQSAVQIISTLGALGAIFFRLGKFETKHEMALAHIVESVNGFKTEIREWLKSELGRVNAAVAVIEGESKKVQTWESRFVALEGRVGRLEGDVKGLDTDIDKIKSKPSGTMPAVKP